MGARLPLWVHQRTLKRRSFPPRARRGCPAPVENPPFPIFRRVPPNTKSIVVGGLTMTHHRVENGRREFLVTIAGGIAGLAVGSLSARVLAQPPSQHQHNRRRASLGAHAAESYGALGSSADIEATA